MQPIHAYYDPNGKLDSDSQQQGYSRGWDLTTLNPERGGGSIQGHVSSGGNPPNYWTHQFFNGSLANEQCMSLIAHSDSRLERGAIDTSDARGLNNNNNCGFGFYEYDSNVGLPDSQFDDIPLWQKSPGPNAVATQNAPGPVIQTASLHVEPSATAPTSVTFSPEHAHGLIDLRNISEIFPNFSQLVFQDPRGSGYYCRLAGCTSPFRVFASIADVIEHIRSEDAIISRPYGVWCSCNKWLSSKQVGLRHVRSLNGGKQCPCPYCSMRFKRLDEVKAHVRARHLDPPKRIARTKKKKIRNTKGSGSSRRNLSYDD